MPPLSVVSALLYMFIGPNSSRSSATAICHVTYGHAPRSRLPAPPSVGTACLPVGRDTVIIRTESSLICQEIFGGLERMN